MADEFKRMRQITGTTADWAAHNIVLGLGEIGVERISSKDVRIKIGDGINPWSVLSYASSADIIGPTVQAALDAKLAKTGGTLTGPLTLAREAASNMEPVTLGQLNAERTAVNAALAGMLHKTGDNMTGPLTLHADPVSDLEAATRQYVDNGDESKVNRSGDTMGGPLHVSGDPLAPVYDTEMVSKVFVTNGPYLTTVGGSAAYAGRVVKLNASGKLDSSIVPAASTYYGTVDLTAIYTLTATYADGDYYVSSHTGPIDGSWAGKIFGNPTDAGAGQYLIHRQGHWDLVGESAGATQIEGKVNRSGDAMLGRFSTAASVAGAAGFSVTPGVDPTTLTNGDVWVVGDTFKFRAGGATASVKGVNTGDQTITLSGDLVGSGTSALAATIANNAVTVAKMQAVPAGSILGRATAGNGNLEVIPFATLRAALALGVGDVVGLVAALAGKQDASADLASIAGLTGATGLLRKTAAGAWELDGTGYVNKAGDTMSGRLMIQNDNGAVAAVSLHKPGVAMWDYRLGDAADVGVYSNSGRWAWYCNGTDLFAPGNIVAYWSDARLKEEIVDLEGYEERVMGLRPVSFQWNEKGQKLTHKPKGQREIGFIAQETLQVCDQYVAENSTFHDEGGAPYLTVQKDQMIADLVAMVQNLTHRIRDLEEKLA